jgi:hypothetical protein
MELVQGEKFRLLSDNNKIFYCNTHDVNNFFININFDHKFILISHNSDGNITTNPIRDFDCDFKLIPKNLVKWFGQNVCYNDERLIPIPLGFENSEWFVNENKRGKIQNIIHTEKQIKNLVYLNVNVNNNIIERKLLYEILNNKSYVTIEKFHNGINFNNYLNNLYNHEFMICPPGNGHDVHQPWEALHINTIPILKRSFHNKLYEDLPVCFVNNWNELIDENFLISELKRIKNNNYDMKKLDFNYWKNLILKEVSKL